MINVRTSGVTTTTTNLDGLADLTLEVAMGDNNVGLKLNRLYKPWLVIDTVNSCASFRNNFTDTPFVKSCTKKNGRSGINLTVGIGNNARYTKIALASIIAFIKDTIERNGVYRKSYVDYEGAHIDGSGSGSFGLKENNYINNVELTLSYINKRQYQAFIKAFKLGYWVGLSCNKDREMIDFILSKDWDNNIFTLEEKFNLKNREVNGMTYHFK